MVQQGNAISQLEVLLSTDTDNDWVANYVEDRQGDGDGNDDGVQDSGQQSVATIEASERQSDLTFDITESDQCGQILEIVSTSETSIGRDDDGWVYPYGLNRFRVQCPSVTVRVFYHGITGLSEMAYRKWSPTEDRYINMANRTTLTYGTSSDGVEYVEFTIVDNSPLDDDPAVGVIVDDNGPAEEGSSSTDKVWWGKVSILREEPFTHGTADSRNANYTPTDWQALKAKIDALEGDQNSVEAMKIRMKLTNEENSSHADCQ